MKSLVPGLLEKVLGVFKEMVLRQVPGVLEEIIVVHEEDLQEVLHILQGL